jgi:autotransporter-associated beta strand protein
MDTTKDHGVMQTVRKSDEPDEKLLQVVDAADGEIGLGAIPLCWRPIEDGTISAGLVESGSLTMLGEGTMVLSGDNTYSGETITSGRLCFHAPAAICDRTTPLRSGTPEKPPAVLPKFMESGCVIKSLPVD